MSASDSVTPGLYSEALLRSSRLLRTERSYALRRALVACERIGDFTGAAIGTAVALSLNAPNLHLLHEITAISIVCGLIAVLDLQANHAYDGGGSLLQIRETERIVRASVHSVLLLIPLSLILTSVISKSAVVIAPMTIAISLMVQKRCFFLILRHLDRYQNGANRIVIYGAGSADRRIVSSLLRSIRLGFLPVAIIDDSPEAMDRQVVELGYRWRSSIAVHAAPISPEFLASCECDTLVVIANRLTSAQTAIAAKCARLAGAQVAFASDPDVHDSPWTNLKDMDGAWMSFADKSHNPSVLYELSKRMLDIALSSIALIAACPLFLLADDPNPAGFARPCIVRPRSSGLEWQDLQNLQVPLYVLGKRKV